MKLKMRKHLTTWRHGSSCDRPARIVREDAGPVDLRTPWCEAAGDEELLFADGFDAAIIGTAQRCSEPAVVVYDGQRCLEILCEDKDLSMDDAEEYMSFNVTGAWVGPRTPVFVWRGAVTVASEPVETEEPPANVLFFPAPRVCTPW